MVVACHTLHGNESARTSPARNGASSSLNSASCRALSRDLKNACSLPNSEKLTVAALQADLPRRLGRCGIDRQRGAAGPAGLVRMTLAEPGSAIRTENHVIISALTSLLRLRVAKAPRTYRCGALCWSMRREPRCTEWRVSHAIFVGHWG
jgi:hypothetical protein